MTTAQAHSQAQEHQRQLNLVALLTEDNCLLIETVKQLTNEFAFIRDFNMINCNHHIPKLMVALGKECISKLKVPLTRPRNVEGETK